jgi:hypothetical protein
MRIKAFMAVAAVAISGAVATTTEASAAQLTPTEVTIQAESGGDFFGYVHSSNSNCEANRKVTLFKMVGSSPDRSVDQKIGSDTSEPNGPDSMWSTGNTGQRKGKFYARVAKTSFCGADICPVVKAQK